MINRNSYKDCDARLLASDINTPAFFLIYKDTVMIGIPTGQPIAIEIISDEIATAFKGYFKEFWKRTKPFSS